MADLREVGRAAAALRSALHSLGIRGDVVIEIDSDKWKALVDAGYRPIGDQLNVAVLSALEGDAFEIHIRRRHSHVPVDLGLQPPTIETRVELLEKALRHLVEGLPAAIKATISAAVTQ